MQEQRGDDGTMVLILGLVSAVFMFVGPAAVIMGNRVLPNLTAGTQQYNYARTGWIVGWIATVYLALTVLFVVGMFGVMMLTSGLSG